MKLIGREATYPKGENKGHINPDEMLAVYAAMIPPSKLDAASQMAKSDSDKEIVDDFMAGLDFGSAGMERSEIAKLGKTPAEKALDIITKTAEDYAKDKEGETEMSAEDLSQYTSGEDVQAPEIGIRRQTDKSGRGDYEAEVYTGDPDRDRTSTTGKMPKIVPPRSRFRRRKPKNESTEMSRAYLRKMIHEALKGRR